MKLRLKNLWKLRTAIIKTHETAAYYLPQKRASFLAFFYKARANTQQVLLVPGAYLGGTIGPWPPLWVARIV